MAGNKLKVEFSEDLIKMIKLLKTQRFSDSRIGYDNYELYNESQLFDVMALALGLQEHAIKGTEENPFGATYDEEATKKMKELDAYLVENLEYIEEILHQFCEEGIKVGKYTCLAYQRIWKYEG